MSVNRIPLDYYELFQAFSQGTITDAQLKRLEEILASDPQARQVYYDLLDVEQGLHEIACEQAVAPVLVEQRTAPKRGVLWPTVWGALAATIASVVVILGLEWSAYGRPPWVAVPSQQTLVVSNSPPSFIATLIRSLDCVWAEGHSPLFEGTRLLSSDLQLKQGVAEFRFDSGVRLILEGPASIKFLSSRSASLEQGKVVVHGHELAPEFSLITPQAMLVDVGTEYGTIVDTSGNVELHVFSGVVQVMTSLEDEAADLVKAGSALRIDSEVVEPVSLRAEKFQREVPAGTDVGNDPHGGLLAYDGFQGGPSITGKSIWPATGWGWDGEWVHQFSPHIPTNCQHDAAESLEYENGRDPGRDGVMRLSVGRHIARRKLAQPLRMDTDAIYYVSFYMRKDADLEPLESKSQYGGLSFRTTIPGEEKSQRILFGMNSERMPILSHNSQSQMVAPPLQLGQSYFFVAKIVAGKTTPDQVLLRIFSPDSPIPKQEPFTWTCISDAVFDNSLFDYVLIYAVGTEYTFDEVRLGRSWRDVTDPELITSTSTAASETPDVDE